MIEIDKEQVVDALKAVTNYHAQKVAWLATEGPIVSSFIEEYCNLFDDTGITDAMNTNQTMLGESIDNALRDLRAEMDKVNDDRDPEEILNDPQMQIVREKAAKALEMIT